MVLTDDGYFYEPLPNRIPKQDKYSDSTWNWNREKRGINSKTNQEELAIRNRK
jgi:hypothetical protein